MVHQRTSLQLSIFDIFLSLSLDLILMLTTYKVFANIFLRFIFKKEFTKYYIHFFECLV